MAQRKSKLLIVDDNKEMCDILENFFRMTDEIEVCGTAFDGEDALQKIYTLLPDAVLLDLIMPKLDGISVLERMRAEPPEKLPTVVVASAVGEEKFIAHAIVLGASYYMIKPYELDDLLERILLVLEPDDGSACSKETIYDYHGEIANLVMELGVPTHLLGYQYLVCALEVILREEKPCSITKVVYTNVARQKDTTAECVESALRKTIQRIHENGNERYCALMRMEHGASFQRPANGRFLKLLAEHLRMERHKPTGG